MKSKMFTVKYLSKYKETNKISMVYRLHRMFSKYF